VDLHADPAFEALDVDIISIALDNAAQQLDVIDRFDIPADVPMLIDADSAVSARYDVLKWAVASGEPGHTFILVDGNGEIAWIRDYGAPDLPDRTMYVESDELVRFISENLNEAS
jgi:alkyl hydroperoxide reductase subunit AhpC